MRAKEFKLLCQTALDLFQERVFTVLIKTIVKNLFKELEAERGGELVDWVKLKKMLAVQFSVILTIVL